MRLVFMTLAGCIIVVCLSACDTLNWDKSGEKWCKSSPKCSVHENDPRQEELNKLKGK